MDNLPPAIMDALATENASGLSDFLSSQGHMRPQALRAASILGSASCVQAVTRSWADVVERDKESFTALHHASRGGHVEVLQVLLGFQTDSENVDIMTKDARVSRLAQFCGGVTPLHLAAASGDLACVELLLSKRASPDAADKNGWTVNDHAKGAPVIVALFPNQSRSTLTSAEYDTTTRQRNQDRMESMTPAIFAQLVADADIGQTEDLSDFLFCADVKNVRIGSCSALAAATCLGSETGLRMILKFLSLQGKPGHDPDTAELVPGLNDLDSLGLAPIHGAVTTGFDQSLAILLEARADIHKRTADASYRLGQTTTVYNEGGLTALHMATQKIDVPCVQTLLAAGASKMETDSFNLTVIDLAREFLAVPAKSTKHAADRSHIAQLLGADSAGIPLQDGKEVQSRQAARENVLRNRILETETRNAVEKRRLDQETIHELYTPLDTQIFKGRLGDDAIGHDVVSWNGSPSSSHSFVRKCSMTGSCETGVEEKVPGVFVFPLLSEALCAKIWAETENYLAQSGEHSLPMPVRHDGGLDLSYVFPELLEFIAEAAMPAVRALLPSDLHEVKLQHAFRTKNFVGRGESFVRHVDKYAVTLNVCLHKTSDVQGSGVFFYESQDAPEHIYCHEHRVGYAVLHSSKEWHQTQPLTAGVRGSVIMWFNQSIP